MACHQVAQHVGRDRVVPGRARRELQRHARQRIDEALQAVVARKGIELVGAIGGIDIGAVLEAVGQARGVAQQVDHAHRCVGWPGQPARRGAQQPAAAADIDRQVAPRRNEAVHRVVQGHQAFFDQHHEGHAGDRLGHRIDAHDAVFGQGRAAFQRGLAQHRLVHPLATAPNLQQGARQPAAVHIAFGQEAVDAGQAGRAHAIGFGFHGHGMSFEQAKVSFSPSIKAPPALWRVRARSAQGGAGTSRAWTSTTSPARGGPKPRGARHAAPAHVHRLRPAAAQQRPQQHATGQQQPSSRAPSISSMAKRTSAVRSSADSVRCHQEGFGKGGSRHGTGPKIRLRRSRHRCRCTRAQRATRIVPGGQRCAAAAGHATERKRAPNIIAAQAGAESPVQEEGLWNSGARCWCRTPPKACSI